MGSNKLNSMCLIDNEVYEYQKKGAYTYMIISNI